METIIVLRRLVLCLIIVTSMGNRTLAMEDSIRSQRLCSAFYTYGIVKYFGKANVSKLDDYFNTSISDISTLSSQQFNSYINGMLSLVKKRHQKSTFRITDIWNEKLKRPIVFYDSSLLSFFEPQLKQELRTLINSNDFSIHWNESLNTKEFQKQSNLASGELSFEQYILGVCQLWNLINFRYVYIDEIERNYSDDFSIVDDFYDDKDMIGIKGRYFYTLSRIASLNKDCHSAIISDMYAQSYFGNSYPGISIVWLDNKLIVQSAHQSIYGPSMLLQGDTIISIDDRSVNQLVEELQGIWYCRGLNLPIKQWLLCRKAGDSLKIQVTRHQKPLMIAADFSYNPSGRVKKLPADLAGLIFLNDSTVYVPGNLSKSDYKCLIRRKPSNIIIDLRVYPTYYLRDFIRKLYDTKSITDYSQVRISKKHIFYRKSRFYCKVRLRRSYNLNHVYALQNEETVSLGEYYLILLKGIPESRRTTIGTNSSGSIGYIGYYALSGGAFFRTTTMRRIDASKKVYQSEGISPDVYTNHLFLDPKGAFNFIQKMGY